jgi:hypothetical protein
MIRAAELEPFSPFVVGMAAVGLCLAGRVDEAFAMIDGAIRRLPPNYFLTGNKFAIIRIARDDVEALKFLDEEQAKNTDWHAEFGQQLRFLLMLPSMPVEQRREIFKSLLAPERDRVLRIPLCQYAATNGAADLAYEHLFRALDTGRPIGVMQSRAAGINRSGMLFVLFNPFGKALRDDKRFPILCQRVGLVEYWTTSGRWPDCATEVPYDFKTECQKAAREVAKA